LDKEIHNYICSLGFQLTDGETFETWKAHNLEYPYESTSDNVEFLYDDWKNNHSLECAIPHGGGGVITHWLDNVYELPNVLQLIRLQIEVLKKHLKSSHLD
jgi:hypothetical protein